MVTYIIMNVLNCVYYNDFVYYNGIVLYNDLDRSRCFLSTLSNSYI